MTDILQVQDDPRLLQEMLEDAAQAPEHFKPTNYWAVYAKRFVPELRALGLRDFRRRKNSVLSSFGATDTCLRREINLYRSKLFNNRLTRTIPSWSTLYRRANSFLNRVLPFDEGPNPEDVTRLAFEVARSEGLKSGARPLNQLNASLHGNPEDVVYIDGKAYTLSILYYYLRYAYCCRYLDFERISVLAELGGGVGKQIEVIKKLHPRISVLVFDIPPQLYVCHQYLSAVFPDAVVPYRDTKSLVSIPRDCDGRIFIFGNWKFPLLSTLDVDLFWNAASFQEMEPEVVFNYLGIVNERTRHAFLQEAMGGKARAGRKGQLGVLTPTTFEHYQKGLSNFRCRDLSPSLTPLGPSKEGSDSFWERTPQPPHSAQPGPSIS